VLALSLTARSAKNGRNSAYSWAVAALRSGLSWDDLVPLLPSHATERANALIVELREVSREIRAMASRICALPDHGN
jgi:hypothetical protein